MKERKEIEEKYKWDLTKLVKDDEEFYKKLEELKGYIPKIKKFEGKLKDKDELYKYLMLNQEFFKKADPCLLYSHLKFDECMSDNDRNIMSEHVDNFLQKLSYETSFATAEINALPNKIIDEILMDKRFEDYYEGFKDIKKTKKHNLSKKEEKLLSGMNFLGGFSANMDCLSDIDIKFDDVEDEKGEKHELNHSNCTKYVRSKDRTLRKNAFINLNKKYGDFINTFSNNYISHVKANCYFSKVRKYDSAISRALENEKIDRKVYDKLIEEVSKNIDILYDYFKMKQKLLNLDEFYIYDNLVDVSEKSEKHYTYDEAIEIVKQAVAPLGEEYQNLIQRAKDERWIDVMPNKDKCSGAYQTAVYRITPYVLVNFENDLESIFTLAHELGHAMHSYFSDTHQCFVKADYPIFLAEIASTTNEMLLINYLLKNAKTKAEKNALYNEFFDEVKGTIYRQTMFAEFEEKVHDMCEKEEPLTKDSVCDVYYKLNEKYFGKDVKLIDEIKYEWARVPHFFTSFYVYKYATGLICAISFANRILSHEEGALEAYIKFISSGGSLPPLETLKQSGCDLTDSKTFTTCFEYLRKMLKDWQEL